MKYQNNPKVMGLLSKLGGSGGGGFPGFGGGAPPSGGAGGFPFGGGFPGFPGAGAEPTPPGNADAEMKSPPKADFHDDGLD